jgi:hypothetical protein
MSLSIRKYKFFGLAIFDIVSSIIGLVLVFVLVKYKHFPKLSTGPFIIAGILLAVPVGIVSHIIFNVNTQLNYTLGLSNKPTQ